MKNTILIIILLVVCLVLFKKTKEGFDNIINNGNSTGNSDIKNELVNNIDNTRNKMKNDYKVFNDETATMANDQYNKFMILSIVTLTALIGTIIYAKM
jgi:hypothetical protein